MDITAARTELAVYLRDALIDDAGGVDPTLSNLHWGDADLDVCLRTALGAVASLRADSHKKRFTLTTVSGSVQDVPAGCDECTGILGVMDGDRLDTSRQRRKADNHVAHRLAGLLPAFQLAFHTATMV